MKFGYLSPESLVSVSEKFGGEPVMNKASVLLPEHAELYHSKLIKNLSPLLVVLKDIHESSELEGSCRILRSMIFKSD